MRWCHDVVIVCACGMYLSTILAYLLLSIHSLYSNYNRCWSSVNLASQSKRMQGFVLRLLRERESTTSFIDTRLCWKGSLRQELSSSQTSSFKSEADKSPVATVLINFTRSYPVLFNLEETQRLYLLCMILKAIVPWCQVVINHHSAEAVNSHVWTRHYSPHQMTIQQSVTYLPKVAPSAVVQRGATAASLVPQVRHLLPK